MSRTSKIRGFTLVELLVVIGIIALLISILLPSLNKARTQARVVECSARLRQLAQATMLYVNEFKGSLPPMAFSETSYPNGSWGRPTIFPAGAPNVNQVSYLAKYLRGRVVTQNEQVAKLYMCAEVGYDFTLDEVRSGYSYRYNSILGGQDTRTWGTRTGFQVFKPWKMSRVRDSSNVALFGEGDAVTGALTQGAMALVTEEVRNQPSNMFGHNPRYAYYLHGRKTTGERYFSSWNGNPNNPVYVGLTNIGYCDGSVRTIVYKVNAYPQPPFPGTWIDPHKVGVPEWTDARP